jgi:MFS family permease
VLNISRGLQGTGAAIVNVASLALVGAAFTDPAAKAKAIGSWTGIAAIGLAIGPTVGGVLTDEFDWRSIFWVNPGIGLAAVVLTLLFVRESRDPTRRRFDWAGQALFNGRRPGRRGGARRVGRALATQVIAVAVVVHHTSPQLRPGS